MSNDHLAGHESLGADAVCAQCGTVNAEGVFICRTCGNNLRDQRAIRLQAEHQLLEHGEESDGGGVGLRGALTVAGLVIILVTMFNVEAISAWLVDIQNPRVDPLATLWSGGDASAFDQMLEPLRLVPPTMDRLLAAQDLYSEGGVAAGQYAVFHDGLAVGSAAVALEGDLLRFAAILDGGAEVRGQGRLLPGARLQVPWDNAGVQVGSQRYSAAGAAVQQENGAIECYGRSDLDDNHYVFYLHRLPGE